MPVVLSDHDSIINHLLKNRGLETKKQIEEFFHPPHPEKISLKEVGLSDKSIRQAADLIRRHIHSGNQIFIYGDYDVDGLCSTAILWETLHAAYPGILPHIPHRRDEGYGLSTKGIDQCLANGAKLIITVDNGIVAHEQVKYCRDHGCDLIIIDHHEPGDSLPPANVVLHSASTTAAGLCWFFTREFSGSANSESLSLCALSVICDIVPLLGINRSLAAHGLSQLNSTTRPGLLALYKEAGLLTINDHPAAINAYHVGFIIGPRLNATGRLEHALESLRLLCTRNPKQASDLAAALGSINRTRQEMTRASVTHALENADAVHLPKLLIAADKSYDQGIIGLVAAKLVEKYHRPAIVISVGDTESKASARSVPGFHITDHIRRASSMLVNVGGHAMAAGFTVETVKLEQLHKFLADLGEEKIDASLLVPKRRIDAEVSISIIDLDLFLKLKAFEPFGLGNPTPVFLSRNVPVSQLRQMGQNNQHLKFKAGSLEAVYFNAPDLSIAPKNYDLIFKIGLNEWNGRSHLQMIVQDIIIEL